MKVLGGPKCCIFNKIVGIKVSHVYFLNYLCYYIPAHGTHIYLLLCIIYIYDSVDRRTSCRGGNFA